jgi:hypothetical protein
LKWYSIGAFSFPSAWVALVAAFMVTGIFIRLYYDRNNNDWFGNSVFSFILAWKLSVVLFDFKGVISQPLSILYFNGGSKGFWLGITISLIYIVLKGEKRQLISSWVLIVLVYEGASGFLADSASVLSAFSLLMGFVVFYLVLKKGKKKLWMLLFIGIQLVNNIFQGSAAWTESAAYIVVTIVVLVIDRGRIREGCS